MFSNQSIASFPDETRIIDFSNPLEFGDKILLNEFLLENPGVFFYAGRPYPHHGMQLVFSDHMLRQDTDCVEEDGRKFQQHKIDVLAARPLAKGGFGYVLESVKTLTLALDSLIEKSDGNYLVKLMANYPSSFGKIRLFGVGNGIHSTRPENLCREYEAQCIIGGFNPREIVIQKEGAVTLYFLTFRRFKGETLSKFNLEDPQIDVSERFRLSMALLLALKKQLLQYGLVHRDIKPLNIIVDPENWMVKIIDAGMVMSLASPNYSFRGTPEYAASELLSGFCNDKTDLASMGLAFADLWKNMHPEFPCNNCEDRADPEFLRRRREVASLNLAYDTTGSMRNIIHRMTIDDPDLRFSVENCIKACYSALLSMKYPHAIHAKLKSDFYIGMKLHALFSEKMTFNHRSMRDFRKFLNGVFGQVGDNEIEIRELVAGLQYHVFDQARTKSEVINLYKQLRQAYKSMTEKYLLLIQLAQEKVGSTELRKSDALLGLFIELNLKLYCFKDEPFDLDVLASFINGLGKDYYHHFFHLIMLIAESEAVFIRIVKEAIMAIPRDDQKALLALSQVLNPALQFDTPKQLASWVDSVFARHKGFLELLNRQLKAADNPADKERISYKIEKRLKMHENFDLAAMSKPPKLRGLASPHIQQNLFPPSADEQAVNQNYPDRRSSLLAT